MKQTIKRTVKPKLFVSFSSYKTFKNCPELYRQQYLIPRDEQDEDFEPFDNYEASIGSAVQSVFEHLINKGVDISNFDMVLKRIDSDILYLADALVPLHRYSFNNHKMYMEDNHIITKFENFAVDTSEVSLRQIKRKFISEVATMYRKPLIKFRELYDIKKMSSEVKLEQEFKDFILGGRIDFIHYIDKSHIEILDGKRQYNPLWVDKEQVLMYGILASQQLNRNIKKLGYWDWSTNKIHNIPFDKKEFEQTLNNIQDFVEKLNQSIKTGKFRKKKGYYCKWCPIKEQCDRYNDTATDKGEFEEL